MALKVNQGIMRDFSQQKLENAQIILVGCSDLPNVLKFPFSNLCSLQEFEKLIGVSIQNQFRGVRRCYFLLWLGDQSSLIQIEGKTSPIIIFKLSDKMLIKIAAMLFVLLGVVYGAPSSGGGGSPVSMIAGNAQSVYYYPRWFQFKGMFNIAFNNQVEELARKKIYLINVMFFIEDSFQNFPRAYKVSNTSHLKYNESLNNLKIPATKPVFEDFEFRFNKTYPNASVRAYRQKVFYSNMVILPIMTNYSDMTPNEFEDEFLPANLVVDDDSSKQLIKFKIYVMRNQTKPGNFSLPKKTMDMNLEDPSKSVIVEETPRSQLQPKKAGSNQPQFVNQLQPVLSTSYINSTQMKFVNGLTPFRSGSPQPAQPFQPLPPGAPAPFLNPVPTFSSNIRPSSSPLRPVQGN